MLKNVKNWSISAKKRSKSAKKVLTFAKKCEEIQPFFLPILPSLTTLTPSPWFLSQKLILSEIEGPKFPNFSKFSNLNSVLSGHKSNKDS